MQVHIVVQHRGDDGEHASTHNLLSYLLCASSTNQDKALERQRPLPCSKQLLLAVEDVVLDIEGSVMAFVENLHQALNTAIAGERLTYFCAGRNQVGEVVKRVHKRLVGGHIQSPPVVEACGDGDSRSVVDDGPVVRVSHTRDTDSKGGG